MCQVSDCVFKLYKQQSQSMPFLVYRERQVKCMYIITVHALDVNRCRHLFVCVCVLMCALCVCARTCAGCMCVCVCIYIIIYI